MIASARISYAGTLTMIVFLSSCTKETDMEAYKVDCVNRLFSSLSFIRCLPLPGCSNPEIFGFEFENCQIKKRYQNGVVDKEYFTDDEGKLIKVKQFLSNGGYISDSITYLNGQIDEIYRFNKLEELVVVDEFEWSNGELQGGHTTGPAWVIAEDSTYTSVTDFWFKFEYVDGNIAEVVEKSKIRDHPTDTFVSKTNYEYSELLNHVRFYHETHTGRQISISNAPLYCSKNFLKREIRYDGFSNLRGEKVYKISNVADRELIEESWDLQYGNSFANRTDTTYEYYSFRYE